MTRLKHLAGRFGQRVQNPVILTFIFITLIVCCLLPFYSSEFMNALPKPQQIDWAGFFSFGQFLASVVLIPVILLSFEFERREFEKAQAKAELDLFLSNPEIRGARELSATPQLSQGLQTFTFEIGVINTGKAPATLYKIELRGLGALGFGRDEYSGWSEKLGERGQDWKDEAAQNGHLTFRGMKPEYAIFPGEELGLCALEICLFSDVSPSQFTIPYLIYVAGDDLKQGSLTIRMGLPLANDPV